MIRQEFYKNNTRELYTGKYGDCIVDYNNGYIFDVFNEISDNNVDIYTSDLYEWLQNNNDAGYYMERAIYDGFVNFKNYDFSRHIMAAQYLQINDELYENDVDIIRLFIVDYIDRLELDENEKQELYYLIDDYSADDELENIIDDIEEKRAELFGGVEQ